jgi:DNA-binding MarR family transcriptional regulator
VSREELLYAIIDLIRGNQVLTDLVDEAAADYLGINRTDARALDVIDQKGRITAGELARELRLSTGAVTTLIDRLERAGYARRVPDPGDRRRVLIEVTPVVRRVAERIYGKPEDLLPAYEDYTDEDLEVVLHFQQFGRDWLQERLANVEQLAKRKRRDQEGLTK